MSDSRCVSFPVLSKLGGRVPEHCQVLFWMYGSADKGLLEYTTRHVSSHWKSGLQDNQSSMKVSARFIEYIDV